MRNDLGTSAFLHGTYGRWEQVATDLPTILIVEDDPMIQGMVEEALKEAGFETAVASSAEEALTLIKGKTMNYQALVTDINLKGRRVGSSETSSADRSGFPGCLHDGCRCGRLDFTRSAQQHLAGEAICACSTGHCGIPAFERWQFGQLRAAEKAQRPQLELMPGDAAPQETQYPAKNYAAPGTRFLAGR